MNSGILHPAPGSSDEPVAEQFKLSYKIEEKKTVSLAVLSVGRQKCPPGYAWGPGVRDHYLIHYISGGQGLFRTEGAEHRLTAGDVFLMRPDTAAEYSADAEDPWTYEWVGFSGTDAGQILASTDFSENRSVIHAFSAGAELRQHLRRINDAFGNTYSHAIRMTGELYLALHTLVEHAERPAPESWDNAYAVNRAVDYIDARYSYPISVEEIAAYAGVSRSTLFRHFRKLLGVSPIEYLEEYRIRRARELLLSTDLTVAAISVSTGYDNGLYFSKAFKKSVGMTPTAYRAGHRKDGPSV